MSTTIKADEFRAIIEPGRYVAQTDATIFLSQGKGDSRRDISYVVYKAGQTIEIPRTVNAHWYGLEPNGDFSGYELAVIESA